MAEWEPRNSDNNAAVLLSRKKKKGAHAIQPSAGAPIYGSNHADG